jgi:hypothetical protein
MADEIPFRSLTIEEQLVYSDRFASCCSNEFVSDLRYIHEEMGVKLDGFDEFYACVFSIRRSLSGSIPFSETIWMNFEKSFLTITHKFNELVDSYERDDLVSKNMNLESNQDYEMVSVELPSCMSGIDFTKTYDTYEVRVEPPSCMSWLGTTIIQDEHIGDINVMEEIVENPSPLSTPQVLPSFEAHTLPVTYPEEIEETLGIPMEVEPLDQAPFEDIGLNTCSDNLTPSSREFPSVDEPEPQSLHTFPSLDIFLGDKRGTDPPINQYYPGSFRMKEAIHSPPSPHVAYFHPKGVYRYFHPHLIQSVGKTSPISVK